jgi:hypothetical protein
MPLVMLALIAMSFTTRWPAAVAVTAAYVGAATIASGPSQVNTVSYALAVSSVGAVWWLALRTDGHRVAHPAVALLLVLALTTAGLAADNPIAGRAPGFLLLAAAGLALLLVDPRAIAVVAWALVFQSLTLLAALSGPHQYFEPARIVSYGAVVGVAVVLWVRLGTPSTEPPVTRAAPVDT